MALLPTLALETRLPYSSSVGGSCHTVSNERKTNMSPEKIEQLNQMTMLIGGGFCAFIFIGIMAMAIVAGYYGKKGE
jgi:hypothetical protein